MQILQRFFCGASILAALVWAAPTGARALELGVAPMLGQAKTEAEFRPLAEYLSATIGQKVGLHVAKDYGSLRTEMESGEVEIGSFSPFAYVDAMRGHRIRIIAQSVIDGAAWYRGIVIARKDSGITTLAGLKGKRFAFVDPKSASGYVYPRAMLVEQGFDPDHFFASTEFLGEHRKVLEAVANREADGGAIYDKEIEDARKAGVQVDGLAVIARTEPIPFDAIAVQVSLDPAIAGRIRDALVNIDKTDAGRKVLAQSTRGLTGFAAAADGTFNSVRRTAGEAGL